jgi:hypothetical protein
MQRRVSGGAGAQESKRFVSLQVESQQAHLAVTALDAAG